jgi:hypothetical protein
MAYVDLVSTGLTPVVGGSTYNFSFDTPISADGSPHLTHLGFQGIFDSAAPQAFISTMGALISNYRIKIGSNTIIDFNDPAPEAGNSLPSNLSVLTQKVRGVDSLQPISSTKFIGEIALPFGLDASRSHRVNMSITLLDEATWSSQPLIPSTSEFNVTMYYGISKDTTLYGSRQDFILTNGSQRAITVFGKQGWQMLGVSCINDTYADEISEVRVNNGAFRALTIQQWRILDSTYINGIRNDAGTDTPSWTLIRKGYVFLDLKRLTAGANIDLIVTATAGTTYSFFPIWVAPLNARTANAPRQTQTSVSSTAQDVESESYN